MNIAFFILPKTQVSYLQDNFTMRQALEKMRIHGYTAIPVLDDKGRYVSTVSEGDFLWYLIESNTTLDNIDKKSSEDILLKELLIVKKNPPVTITTSVENLLSQAMRQNFVPVTDDNG